MKSPDVNLSSNYTGIGNGNKTPQEIEAEINQTRAEMSYTLDALERKLSPGQLMDEALGYLRIETGEFAQNLGHSIKQNPLSVALIATGIGWLLMSGNKPSYSYASSDIPQQAGSSLGDDLKATTGDMAAEIRSKAASLRQRGADMAHGVQETTSHLTHSVKEQASRLNEKARYQTQQLSARANTIIHEQPLVLAAIGIAIGAAMGSALPNTEKENRLMGEKRNELLEKARQESKEQLQKVQHVAQKAAEAAKAEVEHQRIESSGQGSATLPH